MMMRMTKFLLVVALLLGVVHSAEAQFLDRLKKRIVDETERVVIDKTADKAAEKTGEAMDKILSPDLGAANIFGGIGSPMDTDRLPEVYRFDYLYSLKMVNQAGDLQFDYLLSKTESYMGMKPNLGVDITMVVDEGNNAIVTMTGGQVFAMEMAGETDTGHIIGETDAGLESLEDYTVTQLPNRTFLGYDCIGYRMENDEHSFIVYVAPDMEAGFGNVFKNKQANIPPQMQSLAKHYENGLMMYMEMDDKKNKGEKEDTSTTMECVAFEKANVEIRTR